MSTQITDLVQTLEDGKEGFTKAAEAIKDSEIKPLLEAYAAERAEMIEELAAIVPIPHDDKTTTIAGALHRGWIDLKSALTSGDDHAVLAECERGEDHALAQIKEALKGDFDAATRQTVESISIRVQAVHNAVKEMRDAARAV